mmetsp:Transcript_35434/g.56982  ORF Transcript_35434/g.56982 Transcript_35434/m.56982 type:complete len:230 (+) Transcript_35434:1201-1890(+)
MMGTNTPAARAVVDGIAGESTVSAACKPYAKDRVVLPNARTKSRPKRSPKPVLMKARAKNVATTMSQMTSLVSAPRPCWNVRVRVVTVKVSAMNAQAPTGAGLMTRPVTVDMKMARRDQAWGSRGAGHGTRYLITSPTAMEIAAAGRFRPSSFTTAVAAVVDVTTSSDCLPSSPSSPTSTTSTDGSSLPLPRAGAFAGLVEEEPNELRQPQTLHLTWLEELEQMSCVFL